MLKKSIQCVLIILVLLVFASCMGPGLNDWSFILPNGFEVCHINSNEILIIQRSSGGANTIVIPSFVKEFCYNERYVCTRNVDDICENNIFREVYYLLDTLEAEVIGEYDQLGDLESALLDMNITDLGDWLRTSPAPVGAKYPNS